jgi:hypothetical protein
VLNHGVRSVFHWRFGHWKEGEQLLAALVPAADHTRHALLRSST